MEAVPPQTYEQRMRRHRSRTQLCLRRQVRYRSSGTYETRCALVQSLWRVLSCWQRL